MLPLPLTTTETFGWKDEPPELITPYEELPTLSTETLSAVEVDVYVVTPAAVVAVTVPPDATAAAAAKSALLETV